MRITLNLATRPFADMSPALKRLRIAMGTMAVMCIGFGVGLHFLHSKAERARNDLRKFDARLAAISHEREQYVGMMHEPPNAALLTEVRNLNQLFDEKSFSWTLAMEDLETVLPGGVQASSLEPVRAKDGTITLHMRVLGPRDREVDLIQNLEHSRRFLAPRIVSENAEASEGQANRVAEPVSPSNRFNFDILADYNPATIGEVAAAAKAVSGEADKGERPERKPAVGHGPAAARPNLSRRPAQPKASPAGDASRPPYAGVSNPPKPRLLPQHGHPGGPQ